MTLGGIKKVAVLAMVVSVVFSGVLLSGCSKAVDEDKAKIQELSNQLATLQQELNTCKAEQQTASTQNQQADDTDAEPVVVVSVDYTDLEDLPDPKIETWIEQLGSLQIFKATGDEFKPYEPITRGEFITWLFKAYNTMHPDNQIRFAPQAKPYFSDLTKEHPAYKYAQAFMESGYSVGYVDSTFKPDKPITREEMLGIKVPVDMGAAAPDFMWGNFGPGYSDNKDLYQTDFVNAIQADFGYRKGYYQGGPEGNNVDRAFGNIKTFKRKEPVLRYQAAASIWQTDTKGKHTAAIALQIQEKD